MCRYCDAVSSISFVCVGIVMQYPHYVLCVYVLWYSILNMFYLCRYYDAVSSICFVCVGIVVQHLSLHSRPSVTSITQDLSHPSLGYENFSWIWKVFKVHLFSGRLQKLWSWFSMHQIAEVEKTYKIAHTKIRVWKISTQNLCKKCSKLCKIGKNAQNYTKKAKNL